MYDIVITKAVTKRLDAEGTPAIDATHSGNVSWSQRAAMSYRDKADRTRKWVESLEIIPEGMYTCPLCSASLETRKSIAWHIIRWHKLKSECIFCGELIRLGDKVCHLLEHIQYINFP